MHTEEYILGGHVIFPAYLYIFFNVLYCGWHMRLIKICVFFYACAWVSIGNK